MPDLARHLTEDEYKDRFETQLQEITSNLVLSDETRGIDAVLIEEVAMEELNVHSPIWEDSSAESIASYADNTQFDPYEDLQLATPADDLVRSIAYHALLTALIKRLKDTTDELDRTHMIHLYLKQRVDGRTDEPEHPSILLKAFNKWLVSHFAAQETVASPFDYPDFNEQHIRGIQAVDITNEELIDYLWNWLSESYEEFPSTLTEN